LRRIPLSRRSHVVGFQVVGNRLTHHESALERDFVTLTPFQGADRSREQLFEEVTHGLKFDPQARLNIDWATNYGMTILLAWLFGEWPRSLQKLWAIMAAPSIESAVGSIAPVATEPLQHLRRLCTSVTPETICRQTAIDWLMDLPETGDDLRRRAVKAYHFGLQRKLTVLAMLRDGTDLSKAAAAAKLRPDTIRAWLETGMEYGLEAMIGKPIRMRDVPKAQEYEIAKWLATIRGRTHGYGAWSAGHVQHEIMQRFGIMLTAASANSLLHSPLPSSTPIPVISAPVH
jgi:transposase